MPFAQVAVALRQAVEQLLQLAVAGPGLRGLGGLAGQVAVEAVEVPACAFGFARGSGLAADGVELLFALALHARVHVGEPGDSCRLGGGDAGGAQVFGGGEFGHRRHLGLVPFGVALQGTGPPAEGRPLRAQAQRLRFEQREVPALGLGRRVECDDGLPRGRELGGVQPQGFGRPRGLRVELLQVGFAGQAVAGVGRDPLAQAGQFGGLGVEGCAQPAEVA